MKKFVIYRRVSTAEQGASGLGLEAQNRDMVLYLENYAETPYEVVGEFLDIQSGKDSDRPQLTLALALCRRTGAELLVSKLDRLSRSVAFIANLIADKQLTLRVASMPTATNFQLHIYAALAEEERGFISLRTKAALGEAKARGVQLGGLRDATGKRNEAVQENAKAFAEKLRPVLEPMKAQGLSLPRIAEGLMQAGIGTARGGAWTPMQVKRVLDRLGL